MKKTILLCAAALLAATANALAMPVLNLNAGGAESVTIYPDHADPNLFYVGPTVLRLALGENQVPVFGYMEYRVPWTLNPLRAVIQMTLRPDFSYEGIQQAKQRLLALNPNARFAALPMEETQVNFIESSPDFFEENLCRHVVGTAGDEVVCVLRLSSRGVKSLRPMLKKGLALTTQVQYTIHGVRQNADGTFVNHANTLGIPGRVGGPELAAHPELFQDAYGRTIRGAAPTDAETL